MIDQKQNYIPQNPVEAGFVGQAHDWLCSSAQADACARRDFTHTSYWYPVESTPPTGIDSDSDGIDDAYDVDVTGGLDDNGDGYDDSISVFNLTGTDADGDGIDDGIDVDFTGGADLNNDGVDDNYGMFFMSQSRPFGAPAVHAWPAAFTNLVFGGILEVVPEPVGPVGIITGVSVFVNSSNHTVTAKLEYASNIDDDDPDLPTIKDVKIVRLLAPNTRIEKEQIYEKEKIVSIQGLPAGYYGVNLLLTNGTVYSESHYIH